MSSEQKVQQIFRSLKYQEPDEIEQIIYYLHHDSSAIVKHEAAFALGEIKNKKLAAKELSYAIQHDPSVFVIHEASLALSNLGLAEYQPILRSVLDHPDSNVRKTAKIALQRLEMKQSSEKILSESSILDPTIKEEIRIQLVFQHMNQGTEEDIDLLLKALKQESDPIVKHEIVFALGESASKKVVGPLIKELQVDGNTFVRHEILLALGTLGNEDSVDFIKEFLDHPNPDIVESAYMALERISS
ncbi:MAG: HEAT repeat domain-containing protein [Candidatus Heimdallarchaeota archaeon]|nr:HEAT repeat domain-containing protein [Candidatus Heimdallarchaeota archaeon]